MVKNILISPRPSLDDCLKNGYILEDNPGPAIEYYQSFTILFYDEEKGELEPATTKLDVDEAGLFTLKIFSPDGTEFPISTKEKMDFDYNGSVSKDGNYLKKDSLSCANSAFSIQMFKNNPAKHNFGKQAIILRKKSNKNSGGIYNSLKSWAFWPKSDVDLLEKLIEKFKGSDIPILSTDEIFTI